jgi:hypothetical protein
LEETSTRKSLLRFLVQELPKFVAGCVNSGCVHKDKLRIVARQYSKLAAARGLWAGRYRRDFLTQQGIDQRRLTHIWATQYGDKTGTEFNHF